MNAMEDPYLIRGTRTLNNKFGITEPAKLQDLESAIYIRLNVTSLLEKGDLDYSHLKNIHRHLFGKLYDWAGQERTVDIIKGHSHFARKEFIARESNKLFSKLKTEHYLQNLNHTDFCRKLSFYFNEINAAHPFREGNGRTLRAFFDVLSKRAGYRLAWERLNAQEYTQANISGFNGDYAPLTKLFEQIAIPVVRSQVPAPLKPSFPGSVKHPLTVLDKHPTTLALNSEAKALILKLETQAPIQDYLKTVKQQKAITVPWLTQISNEKAQWFALNTRANQLAFIIQRNTELVYQAKELGIQEINKRASYYHQSLLESQTVEKSGGVER
jgi:cell filamentation protein